MLDNLFMYGKEILEFRFQLFNCFLSVFYNVHDSLG